MQDIRQPIRAAALLTLLGFTAPAGAQPDSGVAGFIDATVYRPIAPGAAYVIRPPDSTALSRDIVRLLAAELERRRIDTDDEADFVLSFRFERDVGVLVEPLPGIELRGSFGSAGSASDDVDIVVRSQLFDDRDPVPAAETRILALTVTDRANDLIWQGRARAATVAVDELALARLLLPHLVDRLGRAAYQDRVP